MAEKKLYGVLFDNYHSLDSWGLYIVNRQENKPPAPKIYTVDIPGGNGSLDITEALLGTVAYENREITCEFYVVGVDILRWPTLYSEIMAAIHGKKMKIVFDDDPSYYYIGRVSVEDWVSGRRHAELTVKCDCEPFKYEMNAYGQDWLWDPFDFVEGEIYDNTIEISGTQTVSLTIKRMPVIPTFRASAAMTLKYQGLTKTIPANMDVKFYDICLEEGEKMLTITGNGTLKISFTNGVL